MKIRFTNEGGYPKAINAETGERQAIPNDWVLDMTEITSGG